MFADPWLQTRNVKTVAGRELERDLLSLDDQGILLSREKKAPVGGGGGSSLSVLMLWAGFRRGGGGLLGNGFLCSPFPLPI